VIDVLAWTLAGAAVLLALWSLEAAVRGVRPSGPQLGALAALEVALLVQAVVAAVAMLAGDHESSRGIVVGYLVASVLLLPAGVLWGIADRSRWGNGVLAIACLAVAVVVLRLMQVWG
jgi:hypothetical protein